ncbi:DMT family transporter [Sphingomonas sp. BK580]|uniref:DMT family transporter n=1 Tax=Sphingomonas sp. BK580 TaxID=2586972 RepID=UPI00160DD96E|nr:DMT family transporter [Sphingomonas sp. BK580]MBB3695627.1 drug/metabolite transporter (DMT)-like permease [Sphingomonas sp. BK580]
MAAAAPFLFVLIWSSGFVVARATVPHAAPELILAARMVMAAGLLGGAAALAGEPIPGRRALASHLPAGMLLNGVYLCTSWWAIGRGMPAGIMALLGALQPLVVAIASFGLLGERFAARAWIELGIGLGGVSLVLAPLLTRIGAAAVAPFVAAGAMASILAMAAGTMIQRGSIGQDPMRMSGALQNAGGAFVDLAATVAEGNYRWDSAPESWLGLGCSVLGLSVGALSLVVWMTRHQGATRVSALLLLVPPLAALEAWLLFGERLVPVQFAGFALALGGVVLARTRKVGPRASSADVGEAIG